MQGHLLQAVRRTRWLALSGLVVAAAACAADTGDTEPTIATIAQELACPTTTPIPAALAVPAGNRLALSLFARGTQNYACRQAADGSFAWTFVEPVAELFGPSGHVAGHHYAGPTWEAKDGSTVVGARVAGATVDPTAIPWLLLQATANTGHGRFAKVTYIQRLDTVGGLAPATGCDAEHAAATVEVDYTAKYAFFR